MPSVPSSLGRPDSMVDHVGTARGHGHIAGDGWPALGATASLERTPGQLHTSRPFGRLPGCHDPTRLARSSVVERRSYPAQKPASGDVRISGAPPDGHCAHSDPLWDIQRLAHHRSVPSRGPVEGTPFRLLHPRSLRPSVDTSDTHRGGGAAPYCRWVGGISTWQAIVLGSN